MANTTTADVNTLVTHIDMEAKLLGLMPMEHRLVFAPGNASTAHSIECLLSNTYSFTARPDFLPDPFPTKATRSDVYLALAATYNVLRSLRRRAEAAAEQGLRD